MGLVPTTLKTARDRSKAPIPALHHSAVPTDRRDDPTLAGTFILSGSKDGLIFRRAPVPQACSPPMRRPLFPKPFTSGLPAFIHNSRKVCLGRHDHLWRHQHRIAPYISPSISLPRMVGPTGACRTLADAQICDNFTANVLKKAEKLHAFFWNTYAFLALMLEVRNRVL